MTDALRVSLLGAFDVSLGGASLALPVGSQRLLAFLALRDRAVSRAAAAGALWPEASEAHAYASLRSNLSRLNDAARRAVRVNSEDVQLAPGVAVDLRDARALAHRLLFPGGEPAEEDKSATAIAALSRDLLPDWYDDWAVIEAEKWRQLRLHALEALANRLLVEQRFGDAVAAALAAARSDPLRESAYAILIRIHLAEGNQSEALGAFADYSALLRSELNLEPTPLLRALVRHIQPV